MCCAKHWEYKNQQDSIVFSLRPPTVVQGDRQVDKYVHRSFKCLRKKGAVLETESREWLVPPWARERSEKNSGITFESVQISSGKPQR